MNKTLLTITALALVLTGCVQKTDHEKVVAELAATTEKLSTTQSELGALKAEAEKTREALQKTSADLAMSQANLQEAQTQIGKLNAELSKKPALPVKIAFRKAVLGSGLVAQFSNESSKELLFKLTVTNPTLNTTKEFHVRVSGDRIASEIGHAEGWAFSSGDVLTLSHNDYEPLQKTVP